MKINELMVGDYCLAVGEDKKHKCIVSVLELRYDKAWLKVGIWGETLPYDRLEPIELNTQLLAYNFGEDKIDYDKEGRCHRYEVGGERIIVGDKPPFVFTHKYEWAGVLGIEISYVHQLQHLLRLCGIDKVVINHKFFKTMSDKINADVNGDGKVDIHDVNETIGAVMIDSTDKNYDVNHDGRIDIGDVADVIDATIQPAAWDGKMNVNGVSFNMIPVKGGTFTMGSPTTEMGRGTNEGPQHEVTISRDYYIGETQVTQALWIAVMGVNPSGHKGNQDLPVENVTWNDCQQFIAKLNEMTGKKFRLPTEAEWEFAARGGTLSKGYKFAGSNNQKEVAWYVSNSNGATQPVAGKTPNELRIYDMSGNVAEWVSDYYKAYSSEPVTDPTGPATGSFRVYRNGGFSDKAANVRIAFRYMQSQTYKQPFIGLRLALDLEQKSKPRK